MGSYMTVDELLASKNLTQEELELHGDLIDECKENEVKITEYCASTRANIEKMADILDNVSVKMVALSVALEAIIGEAEDTSLRMLPDYKFYRE